MNLGQPVLLVGHFDRHNSPVVLFANKHVWGISSPSGQFQVGLGLPGPWALSL